MRNSVIPVTQFLPQKSCKKKIRDGSEKCVFKGLQRESSDDIRLHSVLKPMGP